MREAKQRTLTSWGTAACTPAKNLKEFEGIFSLRMKGIC